MAAVVPVWQLKEWRARRDRFFAKIDAVRRRSPRAKSRAIARDVADAIGRVGNDHEDSTEVSGLSKRS